METLLWYALLIGLLSGWLLAAKQRRWTLPALTVIAALYGWARFEQSKAVTLTAIPLSGGSAIFCDRSPALLIDCGQTNSVEFVTKPFLRGQGVNRLPQLLLTHGDVRQMGGAEDVMREFRARQILASGVRQLSATYRRVMTNLSPPPQRLRVVQRGDAIGLWQVLHPLTTDRFKQADDVAVVLRGKMHGTRVLLLSDLGRGGQEALMERERDLRADIVFAGQPAQGEALCDGLLERIQPQVVVVLDSEFPAPKRASPRLRGRLSNKVRIVLCTRETGAVQLVCKPESWSLTAMRGDVFQGLPTAR